MSSSRPSRRPPRPICNGCPSRWAAASRIRIPAGIRRTRSALSDSRAATSAAGAPERARIAFSTASGASTSPTTRRSDAALPPTATAQSVDGTLRVSSTSHACARTARSSSEVGGSERR